ncbi:hypothetical protein DPMN_040166 [Dreissena polymorpha]|uniref:Uncharacterized protein n=1 Tax=Dreissena polymorpha TaxID=45954 RepID=A0A9D4HUR4_DREPO|nr:hypothetical protein DPMN_040166 [Dreissena polymorpha]
MAYADDNVQLALSGKTIAIEVVRAKYFEESIGRMRHEQVRAKITTISTLDVL